MTSADAPSSASSPADPGAAGEATPHNFEIQKEEHRRIRNDPDYDDWEYGTEPLPHEAWTPGSGKPRPSGSTPPSP
jgi:hypothetical protein